MTGLRGFANHVGCAIHKTDKTHDVLVKLCRHEWGVDYTDEIGLMCLRARIGNADEALSVLAECEDAVDQLDKTDQAAVFKAVGVEQEQRKPIVAEIKKLAKKIRLEQEAAALEEMVRNAGRGLKGAAKKKAEEKARRAGVKRPRRYPPRVELGDGVTKEEIQGLLPAAGCKVNEGRLDSSWRLTAYGSCYSRSWNKWTPAGAGFEIIRIAWDAAVSLGYEAECPFDSLL